MDTQQLQAFIAVAENHSFSGAAEQLHLTQPAVSKRIASLEQQLGTPVFDRFGRTTALTQAGLALLPKARQILQDMTDAQQIIADLQGDIKGTLSLATSHHIGLHRLPPVLRQFTRDYPDVRLDLHFLDSEQAYDEVLQGHFELAVITLSPQLDTRVDTQVVWQDRLRFVAAPEHPLASKSSLTLSDLSQWPALLPDQDTYTTRLIRQEFDLQQLSLDVGMVSNHLDTLKMMISLELGWGVLPDTMIDAQVRVLPVSKPIVTRQLGCIRHRQRSPSNAARAFTRLLA
ncbi:LysR family transcriptional regulator [Marinimicrobium alkaliphilum]|uniref:LysR family transcriptional regulator n=1 Tax=Marinimicrobium alkaliphilum TaxID=2202654 RepID=UPI000DB9633A|nr:LysR family transcriptional regulator [Marinimicrobium alkaliphilum]